MTWNKARPWVQSLGSDWRMPTVNELKTLYKKGKGERNRTPLLKTSGWCFWSGETKGSSAAWVFHFYNGDRGWDGRSASFYNNWAFAVRSRVKGKKNDAKLAKTKAISFAENKETEQNDEDIDDFKKTQPDQELNSEKDDSIAQDSKKTWEDLKKAGEFILDIGLYVLPLFDFF